MQDNSHIPLFLFFFPFNFDLLSLSFIILRLRKNSCRFIQQNYLLTFLNYHLNFIFLTPPSDIAKW